MRIVRRLIHALVLVLTLVLGATVAAIVVTQTVWFKNWLRVYIVREANQYLNGTVSIDRLGGNLFFGIELENVGVSMDGSQVVAVKDLGLDYNAFEFIKRGLSVANIRLNRPVLYLRREGDTWSISRLIKKEAQEANRTGPGRPINIDAIGISEGSVVVDGPVGTSGVEVPKRFDHLDAKLAFKYEPVRYSIEVTHVSFRGSNPEIALNALSGGVAVRNDTVYIDKLAVRTAETSLSIDGAVQQYLTKPIFNLQISSDKLSLPEMARLVPALSDVRIQPAFELNMSGPLDRLGVEMNVRSTAGQIVGRMIADVVAPGQSVAGTFSVKHLDLAPIVNNPSEKSDITGDARVDVRAASFSDLNSLGGTASLYAPRIAVNGFSTERVKVDARIQGRRVGINGHAEAYGASATAVGRVTLPHNKDGEVGFDLHGVARHVDLRTLPRNLNVPPAATNINADYHVTGTPTNLHGDARFEPSTVAGAEIAGGGTGGFTMSTPRKASSPQASDISYRADVSVSHLDLQKIGDQFRMPALAADRYKSSINGHMTANGRGTRPENIDLAAAGTVMDASLLGGRIANLGFDASMAHGAAHVKATGGFETFDPAILASKPELKGSVNGTLDVDATLSDIVHGVSADTVHGTVKANLDSSTIGGLEITRATIDGDYHDSTGDIRTLEIVGRDLNATLTGTLALNETGQSKLTVHADSPSLDQIGKLVDQPVSGIAKIDGTMTGNRHELQAAGAFVGDGVKYGDNGALALAMDYTIKVPELKLADATISANTHGTFFTVAGQNINDVSAKTDYHQKQLDFDATAQQPQRSLRAAGSAMLHPDHQEVHLNQLALQTAGMTWQLASGSTPAIQYGGDAVAVRDLDLVNGQQRIAADGTFGWPGQMLNVTMTDVDLASVDALLLRPPQFGGRLNASGTVSGTRQEPQVHADFQVNQGAFRQFHYDTFGGTVNYTGTTVTLDTTLRQNATAWIQAKGHVPTALLNGAVSSTEPVDLAVDSSPVDLGLVQGFTTELTGVTGTAEAHVKVTGTASDPHPDGSIVVNKARFKVESNGVVYTDLDGKIVLQPDRVHIDQIHVLDNQKKPLNISGDLAIHELEVDQFNIALKSDDFKIIDNQMGNVRINSDLRITGELRAPRVEGDLGVTTGAVNLDPIIAAIGPSPYATSQTEYITAALEKPVKPSPFDALQVDVHLTVPEDLVVKANDLRSPGSTVGLGALNVTLGGDMWADKAPWDQIRLYGTINTIRGSYSFQGRRFDILRDGTVRFEGLDQLDPALDVRTQRLIQGVTAYVDLRGTLQNPQIDLSSVPPLEQADILSLVVFNQPINQLGAGEQASLVARAQSLATGAVANELAQSIGHALNLDTFAIARGRERRRSRAHRRTAAWSESLRQGTAGNR